MTPRQVLEFWFAGDAETFREAWFKHSDTFDAECAKRFAAALAGARAGALDIWAETPEGALALVILLDQLSRNIHRGTPDAFAADTPARRIAGAARGRGADQALPPVQRIFLYMPLMHSESPSGQEECVRLFESLGDRHDGAAGGIKAAREHRDVIRRFGRFPRCNAALGRASTREEIAYLAGEGMAPT